MRVDGGSAVITMNGSHDVIGGSGLNIYLWESVEDELRLLSLSREVILTFKQHFLSEKEYILKSDPTKHTSSVLIKISDSAIASLTSLNSKNWLLSHPDFRITGIYYRLGYDHRPMTLSNACVITSGDAACERAWRFQIIDNVVTLEIWGEGGLTCKLTESRDRIWRGRWLVGEKMAIAYVPLQITT